MTLRFYLLDAGSRGICDSEVARHKVNAVSKTVTDTLSTSVYIGKQITRYPMHKVSARIR